ncbi:MAG: hypothetical protein GKR93_08880 [Gammaproteobacteria bacterium]|nr:hypothetical protein [Gammaproteobacteria bacterium]
MKIAIFVTIWSTGMSVTDLDSYFRGVPLDSLRTNDSVSSVEIYTPEPGDVPVWDDVPSPSIIVQIDLNDVEEAKALTESASFKQQFLNKKEIGPGIDELKLEITEVMNFGLPGMTEAPARTAPLSFVVRYYGPVANGQQFADFYYKNHPPILSKFPNIRNVLCYLPLGWRESGEVTDKRLIIGNEVVFDDLASLKAALATEDVLAAAKEDSSHFQEYGYSTHHAMHREFAYQRNK